MKLNIVFECDPTPIYMLPGPGRNCLTIAANEFPKHGSAVSHVVLPRLQAVFTSLFVLDLCL